MSRVEWIVCERAPRWSAALRMALAAEDAAARLVELRLLSELDAAIGDRPHAVVAFEVHAGNFAALLNWLPAARTRHATASFAALVDGSQGGVADSTIATLFEAGAQALGRKHGQLSTSSGRGSTVLDEVWASLPWQTT
jgi:hypothetical protein